MSDYENYVTEVNKIFTILEKTKNLWPNNDNLKAVEEIFALKKEIIRGANILQKEGSKK